MAQVKVFGLREQLRPVQDQLSSTIHRCLVDALGLPPEKRFQRFFPMEPSDFVFPADRTDKYTIVEISMFEGRSVEAKKNFIRALIAGVKELGIEKHDIEITIQESPRSNWGIRGVPADELQLNYDVDR